MSRSSSSNDNSSLNISINYKSSKTSSCSSRGVNSIISLNNNQAYLLGMDEKTYNEYSKKWYLAVISCDLKSIEMILKSYPRLIDLKDPVNDYTALHWTCKFGWIKLLDLLLNYCPDYNIQNWEGHTALHVAYIYKNNFIAEILNTRKLIDNDILDVHGMKACEYKQVGNNDQSISIYESPFKLQQSVKPSLSFKLKLFHKLSSKRIHKCNLPSTHNSDGNISKSASQLN